MYYEVRSWLVYVFAALLVGSLIYMAFLFVQNQSVKADLLQETKKKELVVQELNEYKKNNESVLKDKAALFLKAFLEVDPTNKQTVTEKVKPYTTDKARAQVVPPGEEQKLVSEVKISSKITEMNLYYTLNQSNKASILAKVKRGISINNGKPSELIQMVELHMVLINGQWMVDDVQLLNQ